MTGVPSSPRTSKSAVVIVREFSGAHRLPLGRTKTLEDIVAKYESAPDRAALMAEARKSLASNAYAEEAGTLSAMRLRAGLSQSQLAERAGTSQSHIARIERGHNDPSTDVVVRVAKAIGVTAAQAFDAIRAHRDAEGQQA